MNKKGFFLVIDGIDGVGKSTQARIIAKKLKEMGYKVHLTQEPSNGKVGQLLREYLKDPTTLPIVDALLFAADRVEHCYNEIQPKLEDGYMVISERYRDSSYIYQSTALETNADLSSEGKRSKSLFIPDMAWVQNINKYSLNPDLTIILDLPPEIAYHRRINTNKTANIESDKFETMAFLKEIREKYLQIAQEHQIPLETTGEVQVKEDIKTILDKEEIEDAHLLIRLDGSESIEEVHEKLMEWINKLGILELIEKLK